LRGSFFSEAGVFYSGGRHKMWEGHRMLLPQARDKFTQSKQESFAHPSWDEQKLDELELLLHEALETGNG
jgi:hypothetical protein